MPTFCVGIVLHHLHEPASDCVGTARHHRECIGGTAIGPMLYEGFLDVLMQVIRSASGAIVSKQFERRKKRIGSAETRQHLSEHDRVRSWNLLLRQVEHPPLNGRIALRQFDESAHQSAIMMTDQLVG
jgi:hypothetical protein